LTFVGLIIMGNVIDDISNDEFLRTAAILGATIASNAIAPGSGTFVALGLSALLQPDIESLEIDSIKKQFSGLKTNTIDNLSPRKIVYGQRTVGGSVFHRNTTTRVDYEPIESDQSNEYLHQFIAMVGHECDSMESCFINNTPVTLDHNNLVNEEKFRSPIVISGEEVTPKIDSFQPPPSWGNEFWPYSWFDLWNKDYFILNEGNILIKGLPANTTYDFTGQIMTIEGYTEFDFNEDMDVAATRWDNGLDDIGYSKLENPKNDLFEFTIINSFTSDSEGRATVVVSHQPLFNVLWDIPDSDSFSPFLRHGVAIFHAPADRYKICPRVFFEVNVGYTKSIRVLTNLGTTTQDASYDANISEVYKGLDFELNTGDPFCAGNCYLYTTARYHPDIFSNIGIPQFQAKIKGKKVYDTRTSTTAWSQNPTLILYDYLTNSRYGLGVTSSEIDVTTFNAAANVCDEDVTITDQSTQKRYACDLVLFMDADHRSNIQNILATMAGSLVYTEGKYRVYAGAWNTPTIKINESWLNGGINVVPKESKRDLFNTVKGLYVDTTAQDDYNEFPIVTDSDYVEADNGEELIADLQFLGVTNVERAQRLAKIYLQRHRYSEIITMNCNYQAMQLSVMDTVYFTNDILGYSNKSYRVIGWTFNQNGDGVDLTLRHETADVYAWTDTEATIPTPATSLPLPDYNHVQIPGSPVITEEIYSTSDGSGVKTKAIINFSGSADAFISTYQLEYKLVSGVGYNVMGRTQSTSFEVADIKAGKYEFRVKAINSYGVSSAYSSSIKEIIGLSTPPADLTGFSINVINNNAHLSWDQATDLDVKIGGKILIRHTADTSSPSWGSSIDIIPAVGGKATSVVSPLLTGSYLIKAVDSSNNQSLNAAILSVTVPNMTNLNVVATQNEHTAYSGTKTNMAVIDNTLRLTAVDLWDDITTNWDDMTASWDIAGGNGINLSGSYEFSSYTDLGKVHTSRVSISLDWSQYEEGNLWDDITTNWDDMTGLWDGDGQSVVNIIPYISTTNDDPGGTPTWSDWARFYVGDFVARAVKFKIEVVSTQNNFNVLINTLSASVDMPDLVDSGSVSTGTGGDTTVNLTANYFSTPHITGTIVNGASGDYIAILNQTATSFDVSVYNSSNARIVKTIVWMAKGY